MDRQAILHLCSRENLRPLRDKILSISGFEVDSTLTPDDVPRMLASRRYDLVLLDIEGEEKIPMAERLCSQIKKELPEQKVAFVCNWRVAMLTDCADEILRTEFDPAAFVKGVREAASR
jgi:DNA-binding response OmpR family regulator